MTRRLAEIGKGHRRLLSLVDGADLAAPSALPGWSRLHVVVHVANLAAAFTRQAEYALAGRTIEVYDGGAAGRAAAIEAGAARPAEEALRGLSAATTELERVWGTAGEADWRRPVSYRQGDLAGTVLAYWRELEVHTADLDLGYRTSDWPDELCAHLEEFLGSRLPEGAGLVGTAQERAAQLAGRAPCPVDLGPWP
ncbi:maleylpyruvate isomerase family mycothiol-dependent enzyme [Allokutzneria albata]|uniref:maleylpyruvate isomerase family mycothiol-dependent enzyme n=1 Tax=Allokutzneria albata TaxID=211114 RepID=UPI000A964E82|nr:maleylpyruvate isomerase family mycothiol-dependent enzyme [Allokutzneria albata]